jgi:putative holliday junction resolvase
MIFEDIKQFKLKIDKQGVIMALDIGTKKIGIATSDFYQMIATPQMVIRKKNREEFLLAIKEQIKEFAPKALIIGLPINMDETESQMSGYVRDFAQDLDNFLNNFDILLLDERLSSFVAFEILKENNKTRKRKDLIDQISAAIILRGFIEINI